MGLAFARLVDARVWIAAGASEIFNMTEQVPGSILHPQVAEMNTDHEKGSRRFAPGPTLDRKTFDQNKPASIEHLIDHAL
jgi:hypothetical protein